MVVKGGNALVIGMALSGIASAKLLSREGARVWINDVKSAQQLPNVMQALEGYGVIDALGQDPMTLLEGLDFMILSPGVSIRKPFIVEAKRKGIEVLGEIELGFRFSKAPIIAITGTNGKTTTTALTGEIFKATGRNTFVLGNIGIPIADCAAQTTPNDVIVAEIAGFQLESSSSFHAHACALLNITEDHLDRFGTMENYAATKAMIFNNQTKEDFACINLDDPLALKQADKVKGRLLYFSRLREVENGAFVRDGQIVFKLDGNEKMICSTYELRIPGAHNLENALAAVCVSMATGASQEAVSYALKTFTGVEHRIEFVAEKGKVRYINDSKGTNPDSTVKAVEAMTRPTVLLLGGSNKNSDYTPVFRAFGERIKAVVALGEMREQIKRDAKKTNYTALHMCEGTFADAFRLAVSLAAEGDNVLLSPACASYDMFDNYEQRGRVFKELVYAL